MLRQNALIKTVDINILWMSQNWITNVIAGGQNFGALNSLRMGIGGGIADDSIDVAYVGNAMGIVCYSVAYPTELGNQNVSFVAELTITDYNTTVDVFIRISDT